MKSMRIAALVLGTTLFATVPVMAGEGAVGAYEEYKGLGITAEATAAFENAMASYEGDEVLYPVRLMETQLVSGTNYRIFCDARNEDDELIHYMVTVYENLSGECEIIDMAEDTVVRPVASTELEDIDFADYGGYVSFAAEDFNWDENTLTTTWYQMVNYHYSEISELEAGSVVEYCGREVTVKTIEEGPLVDTEMGKVPQYYTINTEDDQALTFAVSELGWAIAEEDDMALQTEIGTIDLPLSEELIFTAKDENGADVEIPYADLQEYMTEKAAEGENYGSRSTLMHVTDGKIVTITCR